ncbi:methylmalonyl-CoA mutase family protein [Nakamurella lactea]|uniref:methylmalonyl-CoA mutase family protein n=1 Tax=Nakamurella lactea TaxID=459515 RepID=UPI000A0143FC|nr:methylmalonyl-CoA mutase family protein [Nakamurella lactea]
MSDRTSSSGQLPLETAGVATGTYQQWVDGVAGVLRKAGRLPIGDDAPAAGEVLAGITRHTIEGLTVPPLGIREVGNPAAGIPVARRSTDTTEGWDIRGWIADPDPVAARAAVQADLEGGANSIVLTVGAAGTAPTDVAAVLEPVLLDIAPVVLDSPDNDPAARAAFTTFLANSGVTPATGTSFGADPLAAALRAGSSADLSRIPEIASSATDHGIGALVVDGTAAHDLGAGDAQEIGWTLAVGVTYLRALADAGSGIDPAVALLDFRYSVTDDQFPAIAKLRAARQLWARVLELSGASAVPQRQHAVTSRPMMSRYDAWVNMLRGTVAAFAAGAGGAQAVTVLPFDSALGVPDAFGRRIARNVSHLLIGESHVAAVADPAGGAPAVEQLTDELAAAAWAEFGRIETSGGAVEALADGSFLERVTAVRDDLRSRLATRKAPLTGVSEFPNPTEQLPQRRPAAEFTGFSWPADFEALRDAPASAPVFLATLGPVAAHSTRAGFASNALAAGGIAKVAAGPTADVEDVLAAYDSSVTEVVCLTGTDVDYAARGPETIVALRAAGARTILLAGRPSAELTVLVDDHIAIGADIPALCVRIRGYLNNAAGETS